MSNNALPKTDNLVENTIKDISRTYLQKYATSNTNTVELAHRRTGLEALSILREGYSVRTCAPEDAQKIDGYIGSFQHMHNNMAGRFKRECELRLKLEEEYARSLPLVDRANHYITQTYSVQARNQQLALMLLHLGQKQPDKWEAAAAFRNCSVVNEEANEEDKATEATERQILIDRRKPE